jgi:3-oxoacyl-[acyl-carrier-protein] synthase-3
VKRAKITGTGSYLPERILTNAELEQMVDTTDEWITSRTGIRERHIAAEGEFTSDLGAKAALRALESAGISAADIDMLVVGTITGDYPWPATACIIQEKIGATRAFAFDVSAACTGFIYALDLATKPIVAGAVQRALVIGCEAFSRILNW